MTSKILSRVNVSSLNLVLILFRTSAWSAFESSSTVSVSQDPVRLLGREQSHTILQGKVSGTQTVAEVLGKDPSDICIGSFLNSMVVGRILVIDSKLAGVN
jgi:hypothetical protein